MNQMTLAALDYKRASRLRDAMNLRLGTALFATMAAMSSMGSAQTGGTTPPAPGSGTGVIQTGELNTALKDSLTAGRKAGTDLACTGIMVFLDNTFVKFVFGLVFLVTLVSLGWAWYQNSRGGGGFSRLFFIIVGGMALLALIGTLASNFMGCKAT